MFGQTINLITTIIGFAMSATFIVFVCARLVCGRFRRYESRQLFEIGSRIDLEWQERRVVGLEPAMVAAIPTMKFDREAFGSMEDAQCTICLGEYQEKEVLRIMPKCGHSFHLSCIDMWLRKQSTCPVCRLSVVATNCPEITREISMERSRQWLLPHPDQGSSRSQVDSAMGGVAAGIEAEAEAERCQIMKKVDRFRVVFIILDCLVVVQDLELVYMVAFLFFLFIYICKSSSFC